MAAKKSKATVAKARATAKKRKRKVLIVDNEPVGFEDIVDREKFDPVLRLPSGPNDGGAFEPLNENDVMDADIILMDYDLGEGGGGFLEKHRDGKAYVVAIRHYLREKKRKTPCAIVLWSGEIQKLVGDAAKISGREHVIARQNEFDWVIQKGVGGQREQMGGTLNSMLESLESGLALLDPFTGANARSGEPDDKLRNILAFPAEETWSQSAWEDIEECKPPLSDFSVSGDAMVMLRWLLHVVLPFPSFLNDSESVAIRLGVTPDSLKTALEKKPGSEFSKHLDAITYRGALHDFMGKRWWKAGISNLVWNVADGKLFDRKGMLDRLKGLANTALESLDIKDPVRLVDEDFILTDDIVESEDAVQIQPDDWPDVLA